MLSEFEKEGQYKFTDLKAVPDDLLAVNKSIRQLWKSGEYALKQYVVPKNLKGPFESLIKRFIGELKNIQETIVGIARGTEEARLNYEQELDETKGELDEAKGELDETKTNLVTAQIDLDKTKVNLEIAKKDLGLKDNAILKLEINLKQQTKKLTNDNDNLKKQNQKLITSKQSTLRDLTNAQNQKKQLNEKLQLLNDGVVAQKQMYQQLFSLILIGSTSFLSTSITQPTMPQASTICWLKYQAAPGIFFIIAIILAFWIYCSKQLGIKKKLNRYQKIKEKYKLYFTFCSILNAFLQQLCSLIAPLILPKEAFPDGLLTSTCASSGGLLLIEGISLIIIGFKISKIKKQCSKIEKEKKQESLKISLKDELELKQQ